ncbi:endonuclease [Salinivibrio kushneri]|uniref:Endonuclease n=1 Tax=Salinivibrio kushneri TaxID=1908198 RepID=A0AB36JXM5_9GAMM|nr:Z1 domain-containing protein [Salinivibrio kushneri]OOE40046.1 endonuclease [Salinivibrio kushneri]QCP01058.1 endonuclease [Salinivibrio kushneri]
MENEKENLEAKKNFTVSLITAAKTRWSEYVPKREEVDALAVDLAKVLGLDEGDAISCAKEAYYEIDSRMGLGVSLVDPEATHDKEWVYKRKDIEWYYSDAYEKHLKKEKWSPTVVQSLSDVGTKILGHLQDPTSPGVWDRRGLVIGHVQSGKTANYLGLVAKAADAGYKFIIVIAGVHNNLRKQTQERVDEGFVGRTRVEDKWKIVGVGHDDYPHPATLTNIYADFNKRTADHSGWSINDFSQPVILVIKKNVSTLKSLHRWLDELNSKGHGKIKDVPMLMIDDEADNASINTKKEDTDPTQTNRRIREILSLFDKSCYVGYTATPFANIFINPDAYGDEQLREELFPRDFIYCLDAPTTYFGPDRVFLDEDSSDRILETIDDAENYIPFVHKKDFDVQDLPPSLYRAIRQFVVVKAIRKIRRQDEKHCSMLVNVSRFVDVQKLVRTHISVYLKKLKEAIKANYLMPDSVSQKNENMEKLKQVFEAGFNDADVSWEELKRALYDAVESIRTFVVNSKSDEPLDYKKYERDGHGLTAIAVGGLSLSRGLTIEGLCISYMYRNTRMYDTLMQMGRWFGYRSGYDDLCRVHLPQDSIDWYSHIAISSEDLRDQVIQMRLDGLSPKDFGLYVMSHPDTLLVTAANKMRSAESITVRQNYSEKAVESDILPNERSINDFNQRLIAEYWKENFGVEDRKILPTVGGKGWYLGDVDTNKIVEFLNQFKCSPKTSEKRNFALKYLNSIINKYACSDVALVSEKPGTLEHDYTLSPRTRRATFVKGESNWRVNQARVGGRHEHYGLSQEQRDAAMEKAVADAKEKGRDIKKPADRYYRVERNKPLLIIYNLNLVDGDNENVSVPAFVLSFPKVDYFHTVSVVANRVYLEKSIGIDLDTLIQDEVEDDDE